MLMCIGKVAWLALITAVLVIFRNLCEQRFVLIMLHLFKTQMKNIFTFNTIVVLTYLKCIELLPCFADYIVGLTIS